MKAIVKGLVVWTLGLAVVVGGRLGSITRRHPAQAGARGSVDAWGPGARGHDPNKSV